MIVDPSLATELQLETQSRAAIGGIGLNANTFLVRVYMATATSSNQEDTL